MKWRTASGERRVASGVWHAACGERRVACGMRRAERTAGGERRAAYTIRVSAL